MLIVFRQDENNVIKTPRRPVTLGIKIELKYVPMINLVTQYVIFAVLNIVQRIAKILKVLQMPIIRTNQVKKKRTKKSLFSKGHGHSVNNIEVQPDKSDSSPLNSPRITPISVDIAHLAISQRNPLPRSKLLINKKTFIALWDTGAEISGISKDAADKMGVGIDSTHAVQYSDVNGNIKTICGVT